MSMVRAYQQARVQGVMSWTGVWGGDAACESLNGHWEECWVFVHVFY
jgi:hypothetical protein